VVFPTLELFFYIIRLDRFLYKRRSIEMTIDGLSPFTLRLLYMRGHVKAQTIPSVLATT
jgi:hypothetical protein